jgi:protein involved in polysaccharide export with SLBB domain
MPLISRIIPLVPMIVLGFGCGCAVKPTRPNAQPVPPVLAPHVRYSAVRPDDLIPPAPGDYRVQPGDVLEVKISDLVGPAVWTTKAFRVRDSGTISLPLVGAVRVAGMTEEEIGEAINNAYHDIP